MNLEAILRAVARLTAEERLQLRRYLDQAPEKSSVLRPEERMWRWMRWEKVSARRSLRTW